MAQTSYRRRIDDAGDVEAMLYVIGSNLQLVPNDGIAASFPAGQASNTARRSSRTTRARRWGAASA